MKTKNLTAFIIAMTIGCIFLSAHSISAQSPYPKITKDDYYQVIKFKGEKPSIIDFVNNHIGQPEDELGGWLYEMWTRHWHKKPQEKGNTLTVDTKNGYVRFYQEYEDEDGPSYTYTEFCVWNCADKKHKILGYNTIIICNGEPAETEYFGWHFGLYENDTKRLAFFGNEELGVNLSDPLQPLSWGYNSENNTYFVQYRNGTIKNMTKEEFDQWHAKRPIPVLELPRTGRNITVKIYEGKEITKTFTLTFDGYKFKR